jgi:hypothetical protein
MNFFQFSGPGELTAYFYYCKVKKGAETSANSKIVLD